MKTSKKILLLILLVGALTGCEDFLDQKPTSLLIPEDYYRTDDQLEAAANSYYTSLLPSHATNGFGTYGDDKGTDNQAYKNTKSAYAVGQWKVGSSNTNWSWSTIRNINYQLNTILDRQEKGEINGTPKKIKQYIGELYFFRAYRYFSMLRSWGDLPIITQVLPQDEIILAENNVRSPRNEVARQILADLDLAIANMSDKFETRRTRISPDVAMLLKSRVALFEASWLTNFKGTPFVPNGEGWPGKAKNPNYQYPSGNIDNEIAYFLDIAVKSSETIAEKFKGDLVENTGEIPQKEGDPENPYFSMFGTTDMSGYPEVLLWREYKPGLGIGNSVEDGIQRGNNGIGLTRSLVESFLMEDGKPIYAAHDGYNYDDNSLNKVAANRDPRLKIFLKVPGQINCFKNMAYADGDRFIPKEGDKPNITSSMDDWAYITGYAMRKGGTFDRMNCIITKAANAACCFRATEALLNYMEAKYMQTSDLNSGKILEYWKIIRQKAGFKGDAIDPQTTINATDMQKEKLDWGAYTAGNLIDAPLYNIRRERRTEFMGEGLRWMDLIRWRSLDQLITERYHVEGFKLWRSDMTDLYGFKEIDYNGTNSAKVSNPALGDYLRPYEKNMTSTNLYKDGYTWHMAHYLEPLPIDEFMLTAPDHVSIDQSPLYQNPYWPLKANQPAEK